MFYRVNWHAATRRILLESNANAAPAAIGGAGMTSLGTFEHDIPDVEDAGLPGMQQFPENHVVFQHIQDMLYKEGLQDMQSVKIFIDAPRTITLAGAAISVAVGADSEPAPVTFSPSTAKETDVTFTSANESIATVNQDGVVPGVSAGSTQIVATLRTDGSKTATRNVTVTA